MARNLRNPGIETMEEFNRVATELREELSQLLNIAAEICVHRNGQQQASSDCANGKKDLTKGIAKSFIVLGRLRCFLDLTADPNGDPSKTIGNNDRNIMQQRLENFDRTLAYLQTLAEKHVRCPSPY